MCQVFLSHSCQRRHLDAVLALQEYNDMYLCCLIVLLLKHTHIGDAGGECMDMTVSSACYFRLFPLQYASLFFIVGVGVDTDDENELGVLEFIHCLVETLDKASMATHAGRIV